MMSNEIWHTVIEFWETAGPKKWFAKDDAFDLDIKQKFENDVELAASGELISWQEQPQKCLAYILLLDQFTRNIYRNDPRSYSSDALARTASKIAVAEDYALMIQDDLRPFLFMPLMHSENLDDQLECIELMKKYGVEAHVKAAQIHYDLIAEFGRFPHRNAVLGRVSSPEEEQFLLGDGFKG